MKDTLQVQRNRAARLRAERQAFRNAPKHSTTSDSKLVVVRPVVADEEVNDSQADMTNNLKD
jgi:hypothetical protein